MITSLSSRTPYYFLITITRKGTILGTTMLISLPFQPMVGDEIQIPVIEFADQYTEYQIKGLLENVGQKDREIISGLRLKVYKRSFEEGRLYHHCEPCSRV